MCDICTNSLIICTQLIYDIDDEANNWFMCTAGKKWKQFKAKIKKMYFKSDMNIELQQSPNSIIN